jgi:hypothetical protein
MGSRLSDTHLLYPAPGGGVSVPLGGTPDYDEGGDVRSR